MYFIKNEIFTNNIEFLCIKMYIIELGGEFV